MSTAKTTGKDGPFEVSQQETSALRTRSATGTPATVKLTSLRLVSQKESELSTVPQNDDSDDLDGVRSGAEPPERRYGCDHYDTCLDLAASLNWASFTCKGCSGEVNRALYWRAHQRQRKDSVAKALCELKPIDQLVGLKRNPASEKKEDDPL
jgi:hypothetical protein